jgi:hypothetical protein
VIDKYPQDETLWRGVARLGRELLSNVQIPERGLVAQWMAKIIEDAKPPFGKALLHLVPRLRAIEAESATFDPDLPAVITATGDAQLDDLHRLAVLAPIEELLERHLDFCYLRDKQYREDAILWRGVARLAKAVLKDARMENRRILAKIVAAEIELGGDPPPELGLRHYLPALKWIGQGYGAPIPFSAGANDAAKLSSTGNAELDELRRLAVVAPLEELLGQHVHFLMLRDRHYRDDEILWRGVERLASLTIREPTLQNRRLLAKMVAGSIENGQPPASLGLHQLLTDLKAIGDGLGVMVVPSGNVDPSVQLPTGDEEVDELRRLAVFAPIEELLEKHPLFLMLRDRNHRDDPVMWRGVRRLALQALNNPALPLRRQIAALTSASIEWGEPPAILNLRSLLPALKTLAK